MRNRFEISINLTSNSLYIHLLYYQPSYCFFLLGFPVQNFLRVNVAMCFIVLNYLIFL